MDSCTLIQNEHTQRQAHFAFHFTVLTTSRSSSSGNYIDYFRISGINEPRCSSSPLWSPLLPCDITLLSYTQTPFPPTHTLFFLSMPHGNDSLINPISSGCSPTLRHCQWRQVTEDVCRFVMEISPDWVLRSLGLKVCSRNFCYSHLSCFTTCSISWKTLLLTFYSRALKVCFLCSRWCRWQLDWRWRNEICV